MHKKFPLYRQVESVDCGPTCVQMYGIVASINDFIETLPSRYKMMIGKSGLKLSNGQKQRILIARAVYKNPELIIFDEATSSLDTVNERKIMDNLKEFFKERTVIIVAHRLNTVVNADKIIYLENGRIMEEGSHKTLSAQKGCYYNLIKNQLELTS
ncbi:MAG: ATP-binding cassette domain-containing protein [Muribaculaceae bacterium]